MCFFSVLGTLAGWGPSFKRTAEFGEDLDLHSLGLPVSWGTVQTTEARPLPPEAS